MKKENLNKISDYLWEIPQSFRKDMRVSARIYADQKLLSKVFEDRSLDQLINVAALPGIVNWALAMPDMHEGYGFPIGGVAAMRIEDGVISPGGVGYDINCGVRILSSELKAQEVKPYIANLMDAILKNVPSGVGRGGGIKLDRQAIKSVLEKGVRHLVEKGYGQKEDIEHCEERGSMAGASAEAVSDQAKSRGRDQLGTLGSGNHFLEVQQVEEIFDQQTAQAFGLFENQVTVMIHSGSRGLGHQVCTDYVRLMHSAGLKKYNIRLKDPELACVPVQSQEGIRYFSAMAAAANYAWANRQMMTFIIRNTWQKIIGQKTGNLKLIYDVAHNIAKKENHQGLDLIVHRKGATRAFASGFKDLPADYIKIGQPVIIPGTMATASYILVGTEQVLKSTFGSVCHGAGRNLSRHAAIRQVNAAQLRRQLEEKEIAVRCLSNKGLAEEAPIAYKDINNVVDVVVKAGLAKLVARLKPLGVVKG